MKKEFDRWNIEKQKIDRLNDLHLYPKHREVWYISIWINIWYESCWKWEQFKRPVLILARVGSVYLVVSMTTKAKDNKYYFKIDESIFNKPSFVTLSQIKTIDKKRFIEKIWKLDINTFTEIKKRVKQLF